MDKSREITNPIIAGENNLIDNNITSTHMTDEQIKYLLEVEDDMLTDEDKELREILNKKDNNNTEILSKVKKIEIDSNGVYNSIEDDDIADNLSKEEQDRINKIFENAEKEGKDITDTALEEALGKIPGLGIDDIRTTIEIAKRYKSGERFSIYTLLPEPMKNSIKKLCNGSNDKTLKNAIAKQLIESMIEDAEAFNTIDIMKTKMDVEIHKAFDEYQNSVVKNFISDQRENIENGFLKKALEYDKQGKTKSAEEARLISKNFTDSYTLDTLISHLENNYGKYKIKKIRIDKLPREIQSFNSKYENSPINIKDLSLVFPILEKHLNDNPEDIYNQLDIIKFILVFITYTKNMNPSILHEHTFMFYFIGNILLFDSAISESDKEFIEIFKNSIKKVINIIREKENYNETINNRQKNK